MVDVRMFAVEENFILLRRLRFHITCVMRAFESIRTWIDTQGTDALYARNFSHVPCLCRDRQMPVDTSRIQPTIDGVAARTSPEAES